MSIPQAGPQQVFAPADPQREWLLRCNNSSRDLDVCAIEASSGEIGIAGPEGAFFSLEGADIASFALAMDAAIARAAQDVLTKRAESRKPLPGKENSD